MAMKRNGKSHVSSDSDENVMFFKDVSLGPHETQLRFRLIHFWEARNPGTVIQGFIPPGRIKKYLPEMKRGSVYKLINFYGSKNKPVYRVADHVATVSFAWNSEMSVLHEIPISFDEDRFRFHSYEDFEANCDLKGDLYDVIGHMKLVDGQTLIERPSLDDVKIATTRHIMIHVQSHDRPVMKLYLWDQTATDFCKKFNSCENTPTVLLVTTVNTKHLGGTLALSTMSSTRVFMDYDVQPTRDYFTWLGSNPEIANQVSAEVITKRETLTITDIFSYMTQESAKAAFFECTATIDDVVHGSPWYRAKIYVYDNSEQAFFVLLGDADRELTGRHASELVSSYFEANKSEGADHEVPVPEALISTIGQTHKFCVKVTDHNFSGNTRAITVALDTPSPTEASVGNDIAAMSEEATQSGDDVFEPPKGRGDSADEESKRACSSADPETAKRPRCEN
uniref:Replication factor A C-terminal domain-containing protein n=1 Tax=Brassica oleracea var. oleracea TaxID=109376 RepID=A0A0D3AW56_BRAOL